MKNWPSTSTSKLAWTSNAAPCKTFVSLIRFGPIGPLIITSEATPTSNKAPKRRSPRSKKAELGQGVLLSQDEARFPLTPTLRATLGVKGHRAIVGTWDNKDQVYCVAALNLVTGQLSTRLLEQPAHSQIKTGQSKHKHLQVAFAAHLRDIAHTYPARAYPEVVITIDNAPWHRGALMEQVLQAYPHLRLKRLPSYSPQLNIIERFWRVLRRRATHNRLFASMALLRATLRNNICYFQTMRQRVLSLIESPRKAKKKQN
jgi:hypothetical protein